MGDVASATGSVDLLQHADEDQSVSFSENPRKPVIGSELLSANDLAQLESVDPTGMLQQHWDEFDSASAADEQRSDSDKEVTDVESAATNCLPADAATTQAVSESAPVNQPPGRVPVQATQKVSSATAGSFDGAFFLKSPTVRMVLAAMAIFGLVGLWWLTWPAPQPPLVRTSKQTFDADRPTSVTLQAMLHKTRIVHNNVQWELFPLSKTVLEECSDRDGQGNQTAVVLVETQPSGSTQLRAKLKLTFKLTKLQKSGDLVEKVDYNLKSVETLSATTFEAPSAE